MSDHNKFVRGKSDILAKYISKIRAVHSTVAGRGLSFEPGYMYDVVTDIEGKTKFELSELNFAILGDAVQRELKQSDQDFDLSFKNAAVAWEMDKQALIRAWDEELVGMKRADGLSEEVVKRLAIEVSRRAVVYLEAKEAIALEMEGYRLLIAELGGATAPKEVALARAKNLVATKKLELLPYIKQLITLQWAGLDKDIVIANKELVIAAIIELMAAKDTKITVKDLEVVQKKEEVIAGEEAVLEVGQRQVTAETVRISAEEDAIDAEEAAMAVWTAEVYPATLTLLSKMEDFIDELAIQLELYEDIVDVKEEIVTIKQETVLKQQNILAAKRGLTAAMEQLVAALETLRGHKESVLGPALGALVATVNEYIDGGSLAQQTAARIAIATTLAAIAGLADDRVAKEVLVADAEESLSEQRVLLSAARLAISELVSANKVDSAEAAVNDIIALAGLLSANRATILQQGETTFTIAQTLLSDKTEAGRSISVERQLSTDTAARIGVFDRSIIYKTFKQKEAALKVNREIAAKLIHLLSQ